MEKYIRIHNYIEDYFYTLFYQYIEHYTAYPINYYHLDRDNSVMEDEYIMGGSYEKYGVGELSGVKFKKIYDLPVFNFTQILPVEDSGEKGLIYGTSMNATLSLPSIYGLDPIPGDIIHAHFGFMSDRIKRAPLYVVTKKPDLAHYGEYMKLYQLSIQVIGIGVDKIDQQVSSYWKFYEPTKEIIPLSASQILYKILNKYETLVDAIKNVGDYDKKTGFYLNPGGLSNFVSN